MGVEEGGQKVQGIVGRQEQSQSVQAIKIPGNRAGADRPSPEMDRNRERKEGVNENKNEK